MIEKKREKPEDFIGWKSDDGKLEVIDISKPANGRGTRTLYKAVCKVCSEDLELFPEKYFIADKHRLLKGIKPCGCGKKYNWTKEQYLILSKRNVKSGIIIHGIHGEFNGHKTRLYCECIVDGHKWYPSVHNIMRGTTCPKCSNHYTQTSHEAAEKCKVLCEKEGYIFKGFVGKYEGIHKTKITYVCPKHGEKTGSYCKFVNNNRRCPDCGRESSVEKRKTPEQEVRVNIKKVCETLNYLPLGFTNGYKNGNSYFYYVCPKHGEQKGRYNHLVKVGTECPQCSRDKRREGGLIYGFYPERSEEQDYLYVLNFDGRHIKIGRSFDTTRRIKELKRISNCHHVEVLSVHTAKHGIIYPVEQEIHAELRERNFDYYPETWSSTECFENDSLYVVEKLLEQSGLEKVEDYKKVKYNAKD